jgi:hypothetical protein
LAILKNCWAINGVLVCPLVREFFFFFKIYPANKNSHLFFFFFFFFLHFAWVAGDSFR